MYPIKFRVSPQLLKQLIACEKYYDRRPYFEPLEENKTVVTIRNDVELLRFAALVQNSEASKWHWTAIENLMKKIKPALKESWPLFAMEYNQPKEHY